MSYTDTDTIVKPNGTTNAKGVHNPNDVFYLSFCFICKHTYVPSQGINGEQYPWLCLGGCCEPSILHKFTRSVCGHCSRKDTVTALHQNSPVTVNVGLKSYIEKRRCGFCIWRDVQERTLREFETQGATSPPPSAREFEQHHVSEHTTILVTDAPPETGYAKSLQYNTVPRTHPFQIFERPFRFPGKHKRVVDTKQFIVHVVHRTGSREATESTKSTSSSPSQPQTHSPVISISAAIFDLSEPGAFAALCHPDKGSAKQMIVEVGSKISASCGGTTKVTASGTLMNPVTRRNLQGCESHDRILVEQHNGEKPQTKMNVIYNRRAQENVNTKAAKKRKNLNSSSSNKSSSTETKSNSKTGKFIKFFGGFYSRIYDINIPELINWYLITTWDQTSTNIAMVNFSQSSDPAQRQIALQWQRMKELGTNLNKKTLTASNLDHVVLRRTTCKSDTRCPTNIHKDCRIGNSNINKIINDSWLTVLFYYPTLTIRMFKRCNKLLIKLKKCCKSCKS